MMDPSIIHPSPADTPDMVEDAGTFQNEHYPKESELTCNNLPVTLGWSHLYYQVTIKKREFKNGFRAVKEKRCIFQDITGMAMPGHLLAIMGPSGAGKTSLLNALAGRLPKANSGELKGQITVNGRPREKSFRQMVGYVMQDDVFFANLTVLETLTLAVRLKLPKSMSKEEKLEVVFEVISELSLVQVMNTRIGGIGAGGISGGEKKRLNVATELITRAPILFLDEPTSNLDAFQALNVMGCLRNVASGGRTVVCTIHQPRSSIYALFDQLLLLSKGQIMYYGDAKDAPDHFSENGFNCPQHFNPADFFLDVIAIDQKTEESKSDGEARVQKLAATYIQTGASLQHEMTLSCLLDGPPAGSDSNQECQASWMQQFLLLSKRAITQLMRDKFDFIIDVAIRLFFALILGLIYFQLDNDQKSIQGRSGLLFFVLVQITFSQVSAVHHTFPSEKLVVMRERQSGMYHISAYYLAKTAAETVLKLWSPLVYAIIVYWMTLLNPHFVNFAIFCLILLLTAMCGTALGLAISALAPNASVAGALGQLVKLIFMLAGGFYQNFDEMPSGVAWIQYLSFFRYGYEAFMINEFHNATFTCGSSNAQCFRTGGEVLEAYSISDSIAVMWQDAGILAAFTLIFHIIAFLFLRFRSSNSFMPLNPDESWTTKLTKRRESALSWADSWTTTNNEPPLPIVVNQTQPTAVANIQV